MFTSSLEHSGSRARFDGTDPNLLPILQIVRANQYNPVACRETAINKNRFNRARHDLHLLYVDALVAHDEHDARAIRIEHCETREAERCARSMDMHEGIHARQKHLLRIGDLDPDLKCVCLCVCLGNDGADVSLNGDIWE